MSIPEPELELFGFGSTPGTIHNAGNQINARAGDVEDLRSAVERAHEPAQHGVAGWLDAHMAGAPDAVRQGAVTVMQGTLIAGAAVKLFATHVQEYNDAVDELKQQWRDAVATNFGVEVPEDASPGEIEGLVLGPAAARRSELEASRQAAEDALSVGAADVRSKLEAAFTNGALTITGRDLTDLFDAGVLPVEAARAFPGIDYMSGADLAGHWDGLVASGAIPPEVYADVVEASTDEEAARAVRHWLESDHLRGMDYADHFGGNMAAEVALLLSMDRLTPVQQRFLRGLAHRDAHVVARAVSGEAEPTYRGDVPELGRDSLAAIEEGTGRMREINAALVPGEVELGASDTDYLRWWFEALGADNLAALPGHVDHATGRSYAGAPPAALEAIRASSSHLSPVADSIMNLSNPAVGGRDGLEHQPEPIKDLATTEIGRTSSELGRTFNVEMVDGELLVSVPGIDRLGAFADLMGTATVRGGDQFMQELDSHAVRVEEAADDIQDDSGEEVLEEQSGGWFPVNEDAVTAVSDGVDDFVHRAEGVAETLGSLDDRVDRPTPASPDDDRPISVPDPQDSNDAAAAPEPAPAPPPVAVEPPPPESPPPPPVAEPPPPRPAPEPAPPPAATAHPPASRAYAPGPAEHDAGARHVGFRGHAGSAPDEGHAGWVPDGDHAGSVPEGPFPGVLDLSPGVLPAAAQQWLPHIEQIAREVGIDPRLLIAIVNHESGFDADAAGAAGEIGMSQLMPGTAADMGVNPYDPVDNLRGGARYLRAMLDEHGGSVTLAVASYNAGPDAAPYPEAYVNSVLSVYTRIGGRV